MSPAKRKGEKRKKKGEQPLPPVQRTGFLIPQPRKQVAIFGAGIAGLTAAHELIERGYDVEVYETSAADPIQQRNYGDICAVGGMARTRWARVPLLFVPIGFKSGDDQLDASGRVVAAGIADQLKKQGDLIVQVRGFSDDTKALPQASVAFDANNPPKASDPIDYRRAWNMAKELYAKGAKSAQLKVRPMGFPFPQGGNHPPKLNNFVDFSTVKGKFPDKLAATSPLQIRFNPILFDPPQQGKPPHDTPNALGEQRINNIAAEVKKVSRSDLVIEVRGFSRDHKRPLPVTAFDPWLDAKTLKGQRLDYRRAWRVANSLHAKGVGRNQLRIRAMGVGLPQDWTRSPDDRDYVAFQIAQEVVPGEHGFRFFPWFYRNLFDTMGRTPIEDELAAVYYETPRTVLDNLIETVDQAIGRLRNSKTKENRSFVFRREPAASLQELFYLTQHLLKDMGYQLRDIARYQLKLFKYVTSCRERRAKEYEYQSWHEFMDADRFSSDFRKSFDFGGQITIANPADHCDARTYGNATVQLFLNQLPGADRTDAVLNGPTSLSWFNHWRRYLENQGVRFFQGTLTGFAFDPHDNQPWPKVDISRRILDFGEKTDETPEFPAESPAMTARSTVLFRDYYVIAIPVKELQDILKADHRFVGTDAESTRQLDLGDTSQADPQGMLHHLNGIQYFLETDGGFVKGHTAYVDSPWAISSIAQPQFWLRKRGWWDGYRGVLSVDIGDWATQAKRDHFKKKAWAATGDEIAQEVWNQVFDTIDHKNSVPQTFLAYHLDLNADVAKRTDDEPYLVTRPGEYPTRPGRLDPTKREQGYDLLYKKFVLAGTHMQTFTRLTSMEAANESGRHAVNGILNTAGFSGARCEIFDPEAYEPADLKLLLDVDRKLLDLGLPHFVDILDLREIPATLLCSKPDIKQLLQLVETKVAAATSGLRL